MKQQLKNTDMKAIKVTTEQLTSLFDHTSFDTNIVISELEPNHEWKLNQIVQLMFVALHGMVYLGMK